MLEALFGNKTIQKVLIFLFVNGKCYGTQLHRCLHIALTPIQKALMRLEKGGIVLSYLEGKTRLYHLNPGYPLQEELEQLLKKAYTILPPQEKKEYYMPQDQMLYDQSTSWRKAHTLSDFWNQLGSIRRLTFHARTRSKEEKGWNGTGRGDVNAIKEESLVWVYHEKGIWQPQKGDTVNFSNVFRWTLDRNANMVSLEHLRHGWDKPVFLFHLAPTGKYALSSVDSHLCKGDVYLGKIQFDDQGIRLQWRVIGPKKNEDIDYYYS